VNSIYQRSGFKEPSRLSGTNTHMIVKGSLALRNRLRLRDALRSNTELRDRYSAVRQNDTADQAMHYPCNRHGPDDDVPAAVLEELL
jgi:GrpB-like predicted nucleotidyltransferase (UPF0157 family)